MEKIRECGSTVTYYGGQVVAKKLADVSPMTKAIMQEIRGQAKKCGSCQPHCCPRTEDIYSQMKPSDNYLGKFLINK